MSRISEKMEKLTARIAKAIPEEDLSIPHKVATLTEVQDARDECKESIEGVQNDRPTVQVPIVEKSSEADDSKPTIEAPAAKLLRKTVVVKAVSKKQ